MPDSQDSDKRNALLREMYRKSLDTIRVYNPTEQDFAVIWDGFKHIVPNKNRDAGFGKGMRLLPRYIAMNYVKHMKDKIINEMSEAKVKELMAGATQDLKIKYESDPYERQKLYEMTKRTDDPEEVKKWYNVLWVGIEEEYGLDSTDTDVKNDGIADQRPIEEQVLDTLNRKVSTENHVWKTTEDTPVTTTPVAPPAPSLEQAKENLVKEVSQ